MILMVPVSPEVPQNHVPRYWQGLVLVLLLGIAFIYAAEYLKADSAHLDAMPDLVEADEAGRPRLKQEAHAYLSVRPLLKITPAKGDWDLRRLLFANFVHGSSTHLILNLVGVFAGARICSTFLPFLCTLAIFLLGGSLGLYASLFLSTELSPFIPHVGASGGIFALMGTYYVYNFRFRTRYFFWFPSRRGLINLRTSWFFFVDVLLLEIVLSTAQLLPDRVDSVDHIAHVVGFASGMGLAAILRLFQQWPGFLHVRAEFSHWVRLQPNKEANLVDSAFDAWMGLLAVNGYNDQVKKRLFQLVRAHHKQLGPEKLGAAIAHMTPTFIRLHTSDVAACLEAVLWAGTPLPNTWLARTPYDSVIRIALFLAVPEKQPLLFQFVSSYRRAHPEGGDVERKLELLMRKLSGFVPPRSNTRRA